MTLPITPDMLIQYGLLGIVLGWFMFRMEKKLDELTKAILDLKDAIA